MSRDLGTFRIDVAIENPMRTIDDVVFGEPGDLVLLGSRSLEGLNFRIDPVSKRLIDAGPLPAATA